MMRAMTAAACILMFLVGAATAAEMDLAVESVRISYSVGYQVGGDFLRQGKDINPEQVVQGVMDALSEREPRIAPMEMKKILIELQKEITTAQKRELLELARKNLRAGRDFLEKNGDRESVRTLPSGLQYRVLTAGSGESPGATDTVSVHYRGTFIGGTEFDSSHTRGEPATFRVDGVIAGWTEALQLMREGGRWQLFIPPELAYGDGRTGSIGPNSTLIFEVELLSVEKK